MRMAMMMTASLLALAACNDRETASEPVTAETGMSGAADGTLGDQPPSAQGFAREVALTDMYEVTAGRLALEKSKNAKTREFAQMMIDDHTQSSKTFQEAAIQLQDAAATGNLDYAMPASLDPARQSQLDDLQRLEGEEFDRAYLTQQTEAHRKTLELLKAYAATGDVAELRQFAQGAIPVIQKHHDWLAQNAPAAASSAPGA